jgi:hypothetical protein
MRIVTALLLLGVAFAAPGCNDDDSESPGTESPGTTESQALLEACTEDRSLDLLVTLGALPELLMAVQDPAAAAGPGAVVLLSPDPVGPRFAFTYRLPIDVDRDGQRDDAIDGRIRFSRDPVLGFLPGDTADLSWMLSGDEAQGSGSLELRFPSAGMVEVTGSGSITAAGCTMDFEIDAAHPVAVPLRAPGGPARLAQMADTLPALGWIRFMLAFGPDTLGGTIMIESARVDIRDVDVNGARAGDFALDLG